MKTKLKIGIIILQSLIYNIQYSHAQVGIDNPNPHASSILDLTATDKGLLIPRMQTVNRNAIVSPADGLLVFDTDLDKFMFYNAGQWYALNEFVSNGTGSSNITTTTTGRIGIGTSSVANKLDVEGSMAIGSSFSGSNAAPAEGLIIQGNTGIGTASVVNKLDVEGGVAIGSSYSGSSSAPSNGLIVQGSVGLGTNSFASGITGHATISSGSTHKAFNTNTTCANTFQIEYFTSLLGSCFPSPIGIPFLITHNNAGSVSNLFYVDKSGNTYGTSWNNISDLSFKKNILPISNGLHKILSLKGVSYQWKDNSMDTLHHFGVIAQDVEKVIPEIVKDNTIDSKKSVEYTGLIPVLIEAIKEQQTMIEELKVKVSNLEKR